MQKNPDELQLLKKNMIVIVFRNYNRQNEIKPNELISNGDLFQRHLKYTLKNSSSRSRSVIRTLLIYFTQVYFFFLF